VGIRIGFGLRPIGLLLLLHCFDDNSVSGQKVRDDGRVTATPSLEIKTAQSVSVIVPEETNVNVPAIGYIDNE